MLVFISSDLAAIAGGWAYQLELPGGKIAVITPIIVLVLYILGVALGGFNKKGRLVWVLIPFFMAYPVLIFNGFSRKVEFPVDYRNEDFKQLKSEYGKPMIRVNNTIYVAKNDYDDRLVDQLRVIVERRQRYETATPHAEWRTRGGGGLD